LRRQAALRLLHGIRGQQAVAARGGLFGSLLRGTTIQRGDEHHGRAAKQEYSTHILGPPPCLRLGPDAPRARIRPTRVHLVSWRPVASWSLEATRASVSGRREAAIPLSALLPRIFASFEVEHRLGRPCDTLTRTASTGSRQAGSGGPRGLLDTPPEARAECQPFPSQIKFDG